MNISLRKANALQALINELINESFVGSIKVSKFDTNPASVIEVGYGEFIHKLGRKNNLIETLFSIRQKVARKGSEVGVADVLTHIAAIDKKVQFLKQLSTSTPAVKLEVVLAAIEDIKKDSAQPVPAYQRRVDSVEVSVVEQKQIDEFKKTINLLRKEKQKLSDKLLHLNVSSEIELSEEEISVLKHAEIL